MDLIAVNAAGHKRATELISLDRRRILDELY